jgi:hypothetical protein
MKTNYQKYRGKCKEFCKQAILEDPSLKLVRGFYHDPIWGKQQHWWTIRPDGSIFDPTKKQFPSGGIKEFYEEFNGTLECAQCGTKIKESEVIPYGRYGFCSGTCRCKFVGID